MNAVDELMAMKWGVFSNTLVCTGEDGEGVIMCDTRSSFLLNFEEAARVAQHIVRIHNAEIDRTERP